MFEKIIGNETIKTELINAMKKDKISHSYMFVGKEGIGKQLIAREYATMLLCWEEKKICNECKSCTEMKNNNHPDFVFVESEGKSIKVEQIRNLQKKIYEKPIISNRKVVIINDADKMTKEAQNCLLKTLEEPPEYVIIFLIGTNENSFLATIKSRCMIIRFQDIDNVKIKNYLVENFNYKNDNIEDCDIFQGSIGKAILLKDKIDDYIKIKNIFEMIENVDIISLIEASEILYENKDEIHNYLDYFNILLIKKAKKDFKYAKLIGIVENTKNRINKNANYDMSIDYLLMKIQDIFE